MTEVFKGVSALTTSLLTRLVVEDIYTSYKDHFSKPYIKAFVIFCAVYNGTYSHRTSILLTIAVLVALALLKSSKRNPNPRHHRRMTIGAANRSKI